MSNFDLTALEYDKVISILKNYTKTNYAKEKLNNIEPVDSYEEAKTLQNQTKEAYDAIVKLDDIPLGGLYTVKPALLRSQIGGILNEEELLNIVSLIDCISCVSRYFKNLDNMKLELLALEPFFKNLSVNNTLKTNITLAIGSDAKVLDNASRELFMVRRNINSLENRLRSRLNDILLSKSKMLSEQLIVIRDGKMCIPVKIEYRNTIKGIIHDTSSSNQTCYIEPTETLEISNQIESYKAQEKKEVELVLRNLSLLVMASADNLLNDVENLTSLDVIYAKALMGKDLNYEPASINEKPVFSLKRAKHPLIDQTKVVPIDIALDDKRQIIVITGPNTGGKTVSLKTVGLLHLMALSGLMVPCSSDSTFGVFKEILVDIGDEQSIEQSLSTFSSHLSKIVRILELVSFESLILLDELGSGTDPKEGASLAIAIIEYLKNVGSKGIVTTHYSDLKNYAYNTEKVINASVEFNSNTLEPTYRLLIGVPGRSNAIEIASRLGLRKDIINSARELINNQASDSSIMMSKLEDEMTEFRNKEALMEHKIYQYESMTKKLEEEKKAIVRNTDKIIAKANLDAKKILENAKEEANKLITEIKNLSEENFKEHELANLKHKVRSLDVDLENTEVIAEKLNVGDYVLVIPYQKYGTISKIKKDLYEVNIGLFAMEFKKKDLRLSARPEKKPERKIKASGYNTTSNVSMSLDLRGKRYEEVEYLLDQYLDKAILANYESVSIIHGFGTGTIRKAVWELLKKNPAVKSYRFGGEGEGLNGATIVYFK